MSENDGQPRVKQLAKEVNNNLEAAFSDDAEKEVVTPNPLGEEAKGDTEQPARALTRAINDEERAKLLAEVVKIREDVTAKLNREYTASCEALAKLKSDKHERF